MIKTSDIPQNVIQICQILANNGHRGWIVGGCTRDMILGEIPNDWDIATDALPERVMLLFDHTIPTGLQHGTITVRLNETNFELTTFRSEGTYTDGRRPDEVKFETTIEADLARRDFTMNAIAFDPLNGEIADPFNGVADLRNRKIRAVGNPMERFTEDGLRPMRAARFSSTLNFTIESATERAMAQTIDTFKKVSPERIRDELIKIMKSEEPQRALAVLRRTWLLNDILHPLQIVSYQHDSIFAKVWAAPIDVCIRMATLLHYACQHHGDASLWLEKYRFTNIERDRIVHMLRHDNNDLFCHMSAIDARRWCHKIGRESVSDALIFAETFVKNNSADSFEYNKGLIENLLPSAVLSIRELAVTGNDLINDLGMKPGKKIGETLNRLLDAVIQDPTQNERMTLLMYAKEVSQ